MSDAPFDLLGPLPVGTTVLEASAGTGKTYTIAGLVTRYVAEGVAGLDELLVVTFGRAATRELRDRVRERLVGARDALADPATARASHDPVIAHLAAGPDTEVAVRRARLHAGLAGFDAATVVTIHQFCQQVLVGLGTSGDVDAGATLVENLDDLVDEVVQDLYLRKWGHGDVLVPPLGYDEALELARVAVADGQAVLVPEPDAAAGDDGLPALRVRFANRVRAEVQRRKRRRRVLGFDDLLTRLRSTLTDAETAPGALARLRGRYRVVLVDEFQDTDPVQWDILRLAFHGATTLVLIGDPKQAIYAFRGADVQAYLAAAELADARATLARNWRSDPDLLRGLDELFRGAALGDPRIVVAPVTAGHDGRSLELPGAPVRLRLVGRGGQSRLPVGPARDMITRDVVRQVLALLDKAPVLTPRDGAPARSLRPGDIAVIVRTGAQLDLVHSALLAAGIPSVQRTTSSVFRTPAAAEWLVLLEALEQPHRSARVRRLAISPFVGWDAVRLDSGDLDRLGLRLRHWLQLFDERGIAAVFEAISRNERLPERVLGQLDGERRLTDLRHVGEALHATALAGQLGLTAVLEWLRRRVTEAAEDSAVERSRRLDSDAAAVQICTVHASKGLEFPVVLVPFFWDRHVRDPGIPLFHDDTGRRVRNVGGPKAAGFVADARRDRSEEFGEDLRLLYVALTRAQALVITWWIGSMKNTPSAPLHRLLGTDDPAFGVPEMVPVQTDAAMFERAETLAVTGCFSVEPVSDPPAVRRRVPADADPGLMATATLGRVLDPIWRRTSYSALTAGVHEAPPLGSEPEQPEKDDEPELVIAASPGDDALRAVPSPLAGFAGGTAFGTLVHAVLEHTDPTVADLEAELRGHAAVQVARLGPAGLDPGALAAALVTPVRTPLGPLGGDRALAAIAPVDRLAELDFELPLRGGDRPNGRSRLVELARLLRTHLPAGDPLAAYADLLADPVLGDTMLGGYLAGSIDAVLRVGGRYVVVDYKTNRLGEPDVPLTAWDYRTDALVAAMLHAHYPLQALLYQVALHRFLRWRLPDYDPARDLGGVLYLFLRGMCGRDVLAADGSVPGVLAWRPPATLVVAASDQLAWGERR